MSKDIFISLREFCEIRALKIINDYCLEHCIKVCWHLINFSVNTDFDFCSIERAFDDYGNVLVVKENPERLPLAKMQIFSFTTDKPNKLDKYVIGLIDSTEINTCKDYDCIISNQSNDCIPRIVVGNIKIKSTVEGFQLKIMERLAKLPYHVILVPRHPLKREELKYVQIPQGLELINTMGQLASLQALANLTIMGRIFSTDGLKPDDDHNPIEATINSNTLCGIIKEIPPAYHWIYTESELVHQYTTYDDLFNNIDRLIYDHKLQKKLQKKKEWIKSNRDKYLKKAIQILGL